MTITIEKDVPLQRSTRTRKYPFAEMEVGDSFRTDKNITGAAYLYGKATEKKFSVRKDGDGYRCWRTE